jgi:glycosyltransferase involved in cell wall biosynthesis
LTPLKGFDFLLEALATLPPAERLPLTIASNFQNPPEKAYLEQLAVNLGVTLKLVGNVTDQRLVELYNQAMLTLYAPVREPFGLVALESMACGTPVVAVGEGGTQETVQHEQTGLLVDRDPAQFAAAVRRLLADTALRETYGHWGRDHAVQNWNWDKAAATVQAHLQTAVRRAS